MKVATIQGNITWEHPESNLNYFESMIGSIDEQVDIFLLPELFTTGFTMNTQLAENMEGNTLSWMNKMSKKTGAAIAGSVMIKNKQQQVFNRFIWMNPDGSYEVYDKKHLFSIGDEHHHFTPGTEKLIIDFKGFKLLILICYDIRFPVFIRRTTIEQYEAIFIVANWPEKRAGHWKTLLQARAIENQSYVVAVNRVGVDGKGANHTGDSMVVEPTGEILYHAVNREEVTIHELNKDKVISYRQSFPVYQDADDFTLL
ncbi:MAG: amidohydrolase [Bacteroidia bacterium]|jgi:predicted amidohydrolase|nr:amidohydrolase [Bacteroidia bacterium]